MESEEKTLNAISCFLRSTIVDNDYQSEEKTKLIEELHKEIEDALRLCILYENLSDDDSKHEIGYQYSEILANIEDSIVELNNQGINLYFH